MRVCVCVHLCVRVCVCACVHACVRACVNQLFEETMYIACFTCIVGGSGIAERTVMRSSDLHTICKTENAVVRSSNILDHNKLSNNVKQCDDDNKKILW